MHNQTQEHQQHADLIEGWKQSDLTQAQFCKQQGISYYKFQYWCKKLRKQNNVQQQPERHFIRLKVKEPVHTAAAIEIHFPGGERLFFHQAVEAAYIKNLLR